MALAKLPVPAQLRFGLGPLVLCSIGAGKLAARYPATGYWKTDAVTLQRLGCSDCRTLMTSGEVITPVDRRHTALQH